MSHGRRRPFTAAVLLVALLSLVTACTNAPPPPLVEPTTSAPETTSSSGQPMPTEVVVGLDHLEGGFNPHTLADLSPTSSALSSLMLPSVFRPAADGSLQLDTTLMESAEVVPEAGKFTVRYRIRKEAGWSDGAPIAAEDFVYLWEQLRSQPGVADPGGYQLIEDVASRQAGKTVEVTFAKPFPGWKTLFNNLLPAHLLRDAPRGWATAGRGLPGLRRALRHPPGGPGPRRDHPGAQRALVGHARGLGPDRVPGRRQAGPARGAAQR
ncbi:ABC transporter substrate-binding protein [Saccharopolyspora erythraea]|uniref:ABC transporter substrate-binding protein n=1 Tax=Saccharopolyspora erythraea TaxID=1836 RepID=UPI0002F339A7|nr:ABC transporter substrate-binding protein [Saccharopolyspora erythraea]